MILIKEFDFDAAHYLPNYYGKCERLHGHTYKLVIKLRGTPDAEGMIMDFVLLKGVVKAQVLDRLDHALLNEVIPQPSAENIAIWIWQELVNLVERENCCLHEVEVWETKTSGVVYNGE